jgi:hypothetical protein
MAATNVNATVKEIAPLGGATLDGYKLGWLVATAKAAQNDTITVTNAVAVNTAFLQLSADGVSEANTIATNVITLTANTNGTVQGLLVYK